MNVLRGCDGPVADRSAGTCLEQGSYFRSQKGACAFVDRGADFRQLRARREHRDHHQPRQVAPRPRYIQREHPRFLAV